MLTQCFVESWASSRGWKQGLLVRALLGVARELVGLLVLEPVIGRAGLAARGGWVRLGLERGGKAVAPPEVRRLGDLDGETSFQALVQVTLCFNRRGGSIAYMLRSSDGRIAW